MREEGVYMSDVVYEMLLKKIENLRQKENANRDETINDFLLTLREIEIEIDLCKNYLSKPNKGE